MKSKWTAGLSPEEQQEMKSNILAAKPALDRLGYILQGKVKATHREMLDSSKYDIPAWSERQADYIGYLRALEEIKGYLQLD